MEHAKLRLKGKDVACKADRLTEEKTSRNSRYGQFDPCRKSPGEEAEFMLTNLLRLSGVVALY